MPTKGRTTPLKKKREGQFSSYYGRRRKEGGEACFPDRKRTYRSFLTRGRPFSISGGRKYQFFPLFSAGEKRRNYSCIRRCAISPGGKESIESSLTTRTGRKEGSLPNQKKGGSPFFRKRGNSERRGLHALFLPKGRPGKCLFFTTKGEGGPGKKRVTVLPSVEEGERYGPYSLPPFMP